MKVVLDTNVLVSAIFFSGIPARILEAWGEGRFEMLATVVILAEYRRVVARSEKHSVVLQAIYGHICASTYCHVPPNSGVRMSHSDAISNPDS